MQIHPLSEGSFTIDKTKLFIPFDTDVDSMQERPVGSLLVEIQPFLVVTSRDVIILDTGLGFDIDGEPQILQNLRKAGFDSTDVTKVLLSHLHKDHAGGIGANDNGSICMNFPRATYYVQKAEFDYAFEKGLPSYVPDEAGLLRNNPQVQWLEGDGIIDGYIRHQVTGAHSKFHQVFWIEDRGETIFFGADDAPQLQQMKHRFAAKYDYDGKKAMELRSQWWQQAEQEKWTMLFYHDIRTPFVSK